MIFSTKILPLLGLVGAGNAAYVLTDHYNKTNFFQEFKFFSDSDPTRGFVKYLDGPIASQQKLAGYALQDQIFLGVDNKGTADGGRRSTRVHSKKQFTHGLFVSDITHMPVGCGVWPALWTHGPNWPRWGEIDILEGVNTEKFNSVTLHTGPGCTMTNEGGAYEGKKALKETDCSAPNGKGQIGCGQATDDSSNYGVGFNKKGGGIYALEWTSDRIAVWFFSRGSAMEKKISASNGTAPNPAEWGKPIANFAGQTAQKPNRGCKIDDHFEKHEFIINTTLCGEWAGKVFDTDQFPECKALKTTCDAYVQSHPEAFTNAYWTIKSIKVYQQQ